MRILHFNIKEDTYFHAKAAPVVKSEDYVSPPVAARTRRGQKAISPSKIPRRILAPKNENEALAEIEEARALLNKDGSEAELSDAEVSIGQTTHFISYLSPRPIPFYHIFFETNILHELANILIAG